MVPSPPRFALDLRVDVRLIAIVAVAAATLAVCAVDLAWLMHDAKLTVLYAFVTGVIGLGLGALGLVTRRAIPSALLGAFVGLVLAGGAGFMLLFEATAMTAGQAMIEQFPSLLFGTSTAPDVSGVIDAARMAAGIALLLLLVVPPVTAWLFARRARARQRAAWSAPRGAWLACASVCVLLSLVAGTCVALDPFEHARIPLPDKVINGYYPPGATPATPKSPTDIASPLTTACDPADRLPDGRIHCTGMVVSWHKAFKVAGVIFTFPALGLGALLALAAAALELAHARFLRALEAGRDPGYVAVANPQASGLDVPALVADAPAVALLYARADAALQHPLARVPPASSGTPIPRLLWATAIVVPACAALAWFVWLLV